MTLPKFAAILPMPPPEGTNHGLIVLRHGKHASVGLAASVRRWKKVAVPALAAQAPAPADLAVLIPRHKLIELGLGIIVITRAPWPYRRDLDGPVKFLQDAIATGWRFNDARIRALSVGMISDPARETALVYYYVCSKPELPAVCELEAAARDVLLHYTPGGL